MEIQQKIKAMCAFRRTVCGYDDEQVDLRRLDLDSRGPETADERPPDRVVMIVDWLKKIGGGVNTVVKDQIDYLSRGCGLPVDTLADGGDYDAEHPATFRTFPNAADPDSIHDVLRRYIVIPAGEGMRIAVIIHNILTLPFSWPQKEAIHRIIAEVQHDPTLADKVQFIAWTHDIYEVPREMVPGVTYVAISEERQRAIADYFHEPLSRIPLALNAVNSGRCLSLSPEAEWLLHAFRLSEDEFVAFCPTRLTRHKNIEGAIAIVAALNRLGRRTTLIVPGMMDDWQRDYYNELRERASTLRIPEKVVFLTDLTFRGGPFQATDEVVRDLYKLASFLLFLSRDEGFGLPLIEAAAWRLPAVISPISPLIRISQGSGTLTVDPDREATDQIALRILDYMGRNPVYRMQRQVFTRYSMAGQFASIGWKYSTVRRTPWRIGAQTSIWFPRWRIEDQFLDAVHNGLDAFEVYFDAQPERKRGFNPEDLRGDVRQWLREAAGKMNVQLSVYSRRHISDPAERCRHWDACLTFARDVGASLFVIDLPPPEAFAGGQFDVFVAKLQQLVDSVPEHHIRIAVENGSCEDSSGARYLTSAEHLDTLFGRLVTQEGRVGVSFNAGRAHLAEPPADYLRKIHAPIFHVKLSDNQGPGSDEVHQRLGEGTLPLERLLEELKRQGYCETIVLEYFFADLRRDRARIESVLSA